MIERRGTLATAWVSALVFMTNTPRQHLSNLPIINVVVRLFRRIGARLSRGFLFSLIGIVAFGYIADEMGEGDLAIFDQTIRTAVNSLATPVLTQLMIFFSFLGSGLFLTLLGISIFAYLLYIKWKREAILFLITNVGELMLNVGLKAFYKRQRPEPLFDYALPSSYSFPSGHALGSFCFYAILAWIIVRNVENPTTKWAIAIASVVMIFTIGISRIYLGVHYPSDVVAGYVCAAVWTTTVIFADRSLLKESRPDPSSA